MSDDFWGEPIYSYSRKQAIEDGVLIDVTPMARRMGFGYPVAITAALSGALETPERTQDPEYIKRLWNVLNSLKVNIRHMEGDAARMRFKVVIKLPNSKPGEPTARTLDIYADCGPGDDAEPVFTIGFPEDF